MSSIEDAVPDHDATKDAAVSVGAALVGLVPVVGGAVAQAGSGLIAARQAAQQHEFNLTVARALDATAAKVNGLTPQAIIDSDEFIAAYSRLSRAASETASKLKRERLAAVLGHVGPWSSVPQDQQVRFLELVTQYEDIDVAVLEYFQDPAGWLQKNSSWQHGSYMMVSISSVMGDHFFTAHEDWRTYLSLTLDKLTRDGLLVSSGWNTIGTESGAVTKRTTELGDQFLAFLVIN